MGSSIKEDDIVVANVGNTSLEWHSIRASAANVYNVNLGQCTPVALGLALALPDRVVIALDGDGNVLLNLASLLDEVLSSRVMGVNNGRANTSLIVK